MGMTTESVAALVARAGTDYSWPERGCTRPPSVWRSCLKRYLYAVQGGMCFDCGEVADLDSLEFCHVVSRGPVATSDKGRGWVEGNIALGHRVCACGTRGNKAQQIRGPVVLPEHVTRPDIVADSWPSPPVLKATYPR